MKDLTIVKRGPGGVADELVIVTDKGTFKVISEYNIRAVLCDGVTRVVRQDGSEVSMPNLVSAVISVLPAATAPSSVCTKFSGLSRLLFR